RSSQNIFQEELAAFDRRGPRGMRGERQDAALGEHTSAGRAGERHLLKVISFYVTNSVVAREPFVEKRVIAVEKFQRAAVLAQDVIEVELRLLLHIVGELAAEFGEPARVGSDQPDVAQLQPLPGEILRQRPSLAVADHALDLRLEVFSQFALGSQRE